MSEPRARGQVYGTQYSCGCCDHLGGGHYAPRTEPTHWWMGLDSTGQAHFVCDNCKDGLYNVVPQFEDVVDALPLPVAHLSEQTSAV